MRASLVAALLLGASIAAANPLPEALARFDAGDYEAVITTLRSSIDEQAIADVVDRAQALRVYGIACVLTGRGLAAESTFVQWLRLEPRARLDPYLVRPDVVLFFEQVRDRHRTELLAEVERRRPRSAALNLIPPAGQFQNGQRPKFAALLTLELALLATNVATGVSLWATVRPDGTFPDAGRAQALQAANWLSFGALLGAVVYGIIDGFVVWKRVRDGLRIDAASLQSAAFRL